MARRVPLILLLVLASAAFAGCTDGEVLKAYERPPATDDDADDVFTFSIPKGTKSVTFFASTKGSPSSGGLAQFIVAQQGAGEALYMVRLGHGQEDEATVDDPEPGSYHGIVQYDDYTGPASLQITQGGGGARFSIGGTFWDIAGVVLAVLTLLGGAFLYRRHSSRLNREMERIDETFRDLRGDPEACRLELEDMHEDLQRQLVQGRLKESHYLILEKRVERYVIQLDKLPVALPRAPPEPEVPLEFE